MFQRRGRGARGGGNRSSRDASLVRGLLLEDDTWKCDCNPRLPAAYRETRKEGKNKGRWFYTCPRPIGEQCDFFIFKEDADARATGATFNNVRSERPNNQSPTKTQARGFLSPPPAYATQDGQLQPASPSSMMIRNQSPSRSTTESLFLMDSDDERAFDRVEIPITPSKRTLPPSYTTPSKSIPPPAFVTPNKANVLESFTTPSKRKLSTMISGGLPTPVTAGRYFTPKESHGGRPSLLDELSPDSSPTPAGFRNVTNPEDMLPRLLQVLQQEQIEVPESSRQAIESVCQEMSQKVKGIQKARDLTRSALKAKDSKTHELQLRVNTLEAELELQKGIVQWYRERYPDDQLDD